MAEKSAAERTEDATPQRLKKARGEGQVAQSQEVPSAMMLTGLILALVLSAGHMYQWFITQMRGGLLFQMNGSLSATTFGEVLCDRGGQCLIVLLPLLLVMAVSGLMGSISVGGVAWSPKAIRFDLSRISIIKGVKNLCSLKSIVKLLIAIAKLSIFMLLAWHYIGARMDLLLGLHWSTPEGTLGTIAQLIIGLAIRITVALVVIATIDFIYQRWTHKRQLKMTRQEVKEEHKQQEVSAEIKGQIRSMQMAMAQKRTLRDVPDADIVVANPTHYAVAIRYEATEMAAPMVVAKGADFMCQTIKEIARANDVPIIEKPELARALYAAAEPGEPIPEALFVAVAEILATIYRMKRNTPPMSLDTNE
ncbi:MAG: flagellar biosynthesis protein FlhB [bacterium]|nr:flagellar biosynthesis protein FlhB [bacterium]